MGHLIGKDEPAGADRADPYPELSGIKLEILVDETGRVISAIPIEGQKIFFSRASEPALTWKFKPFTQKGMPVSAKFIGEVLFLPAELLPLIHIPFPEIHDWSALRITLQRGYCLWTPCLVYGVEIHGDGSIVFTGKAHVATMGTAQGQISMDDVRELVNLFRAADYYSLRDDYFGASGGPPTYTTSISIDGQTKKVEEVVGLIMGMPKSVIDLEDAIDRIAGTAKWIKGPAITPN
jgi:hypothetical protein